MPLINTENCLAQEIISRQREHFPELEGYTLKTLYFSEETDSKCTNSDTDIGPVDENAADKMKPEKLCQVIEGNSSGTVKAIYTDSKGVPKTIYDHSISEPLLEKLRRSEPENEKFFVNLAEAKWEVFMQGLDDDNIEYASWALTHDYLCGCFDDNSVENLISKMFQITDTRAILTNMFEPQ